MFWGIAAFRPGDASPDVTRSWNDAGWFGLQFAWPPFSVGCAAIACSIFTDKRARPPYPRRVGYLNVWAALLYGPVDAPTEQPRQAIAAAGRTSAHSS